MSSTSGAGKGLGGIRGSKSKQGEDRGGNEGVEELKGGL